MKEKGLSEIDPNLDTKQRIKTVQADTADPSVFQFQGQPFALVLPVNF